MTSSCVIINYDKKQGSHSILLQHKDEHQQRGHHRCNEPIGLDVTHGTIHNLNIGAGIVVGGFHVLVRYPDPLEDTRIARDTERQLNQLVLCTGARTLHIDLIDQRDVATVGDQVHLHVATMVGIDSVLSRERLAHGEVGLWCLGHLSTAWSLTNIESLCVKRGGEWAQ